MLPDKQEQPHIVQYPTNTTSPDIINTFDLDKLRSTDSKHIGRDFDTFCYVKNLKLKYNESTRSQLLARKKPITTTLAAIGALAFIISWIFFTVIVICSMEESTYHLAEFSKKAILVSIPTGVLALVFLDIHPTLPFFDEKVDTYYPLTRKERHTLYKLECVDVDKELAHKVNTIMEHSVNTSNLRQPYDDYMDLLVFLRTNRNAISRTLYSEYIEELKKRRAHLDKELDYAVAEADAYRNAEEEYQEDRKRMTQDMRDDDALRAMPLPPKGEKNN